MILQSGNIMIKSNVDKGLYFFDNDSATGKTYLCKLLKRLKNVVLMLIIIHLMIIMRIRIYQKM